MGVVSNTSSIPFSVATRRISEVSSIGISGTRSPAAPAAFACLQNLSRPRAIMGLK